MELLPGLQRALRRFLVLKGARSSVVRIDGYDVHYYDVAGTGVGPPIVLVHGLGGAANGFYKILFGLGSRFSRVLAPDLPGNGFSQLPPGTPALNAEQQLHVLTRFLETVAREPVFLVGSSLGGAMTLTLAHRRPELVRALGLVAPAGARVSPERFDELIRSLQVTSNSDARALTRRLFHKPPLTALLLASDMRRMYASDAVKAILTESKYADLIDPALLQGLKVPVLLIWGGSEKLLPYESADYFRAHLPSNAEVHVVEGFGHIPHVERPEQVTRTLVGFADRAGL